MGPSARERCLRRVAKAVRLAMQGEATGHDWWHVHRVWAMARRLARAEGADAWVCGLAALCHDLDDWKLGGDPAGGFAKGEALLKGCGIDKADIAQVAQVVAQVSFKGAEVNTPTRSIEAAVVQDADRLDALGAIGVARAFAYGGAKGRLLYDPERKPVLHKSFKAYKAGQGSTVDHFHEKLLLLADRMQTKAGRALARKRHEVLKAFLRSFMQEWGARA